MDRPRDFSIQIVHELKPINIGDGDLLYQQSDTTDSIYFMHSGKVKLFCEINEFIEDEETMALVIEYERILIDAQVKGDKSANYDKPSFKPIISYPEGSYFGDQDIFA